MQLTRKINGDRWKFKIISEEEMKDEHDDAAAVCLPEEKTICITPSTLDIVNLRHELFHAYFGYLYLEDTNTMSIVDLEEIMASHFASKGEEIIEKSNKILEDLENLIKKGQKNVGKR